MARVERILPPLSAAVIARAWTIPRGSVQLVPSRLGAEGPILGAAAIAIAAREERAPG